MRRHAPPLDASLGGARRCENVVTAIRFWRGGVHELRQEMAPDSGPYSGPENETRPN